MAKAKICYISPLSIHSYRWIEAFSRKDYDITLITDSIHPPPWRAPKPQLTPTYLLPWLKKRNFPRQFIPNLLKITRILKTINPDLVHLHMQHWYSPPIILSDFPFILTTWGEEVLLLNRRKILETHIAKITAEKAQMLTVDANCLKQKWMQMGIPETKIKIIPFGVDTNLFNPKIERDTLREKLGIGGDDIAVISTRAFYRDRHNVECLVKAIPLVWRNHKNVKFIMKGAGPLESYLKSLVKKLNVSENVCFPGLTPHTEVAQYLVAADIYVSTSFMDSTSVSLLEAMACGLPPVVTDIPGNREWVKNGVNGLLYAPKDHTKLAEKMMQLIKNQKLRKIFSERCLEIIKQRATWQKCVEDMEAIYKSFI